MRSTHGLISPQEAQQPRGSMMTEPIHDAVLHRLVYVERAMHQWQVVGSLAMALLALVVLLGAVGRTEPEAPEEIRAQAFVLVDREGRPRIDR
jgi:hypothetical protein